MLAPATFEQYRSVLGSQLLGKPRQTPGSRRKLPAADYAVAIASTPAARFNEPHTPRAWREQMRRQRCLVVVLVAGTCTSER